MRQKFLEQRYKDYSGVDIHHEHNEFINQKDNLKKQSNSSQQKSKVNLKLIDDDNNSSQVESENIHAKTERKAGKNTTNMRREEQGTFRSENPRDNMALPKTKMNFE